VSQDARIKLGFEEVDERLRAVAPGEVLTVLAKSGVGKSAFVQSVIANIASNSKNITSLFCSMEQPEAQCYERWAQMVHNISGATVEKGWNLDEFRKETGAELRERFGDRVLTCAVPGLRLSEIEQAIDLSEMKTGNKVNVVCLDYMGLIDGSDFDRTQYGQVSRIAREIKNLAKTKKVVVIVLCQVSRQEGDEGSSPLSIGSARDSGAIEESADYLLGLHRPYIGDPEKDSEMVIQILKNRKGRTSIEGFSYYFDRVSLKITEMEDVGIPANERPQQPKDFGWVSGQMKN
jgi:replicative DNA helicase